MKRIAYFTMLTALLLSLFIPSLAAGGVRATKSDDDVNEEDAEKSDYHVTLVSDTRMSNAKGTLRQGGKRYIGEVDYSEDGRTVTIEWTGLKVAKGKKVNWRVWLTQEERNDIHPKEAHFTPVTPTLADTTFAPVLGFNVEACGDFSLTNSNGDAISYNDLEYTVLPDTIPLTGDEILDRLETCDGTNPFAGYSETWTSLPGGTVPALGETYLTTLDILEGEYLYCFLREDFADQPGYGCNGFIEHEHQSLGPSAVQESTWGKIKSMFRDLFD
jgi:hypothetical protein